MGKEALFFGNSEIYQQNQGNDWSQWSRVKPIFHIIRSIKGEIRQIRSRFGTVREREGKYYLKEEEGRE